MPDDFPEGDSVPDLAIAKAILEQTRRRGPGKSICPSEVARALAPGDWRPLMPRVRHVAEGLRQQGRLQILQRGCPISLAADAAPVRGPIRLALPDQPMENDPGG